MKSRLYYDGLVDTKIEGISFNKTFLKFEKTGK